MRAVMSMVSTLTRVTRRSSAIRCNAASPYCTRGLATDLCRETYPPTLTLAGGLRVACHHLDHRQ